MVCTNNGMLVTSLLSDGLIINVNVALVFLPFFCPSPFTNGLLGGLIDSLRGRERFRRLQGKMVLIKSIG